MNTRRVFLRSCGLLLLALPACRDGKAKTVAVTGKVLLPDGKPAEHATVIFHPIGAADNVVKPRGTVGADGSFQLTSVSANDGIAIGKYQVTVELWLRSGNGDAPAVNRVPVRYSKPETSGFEVTIAADTTDVGTFQLKY